MNATETELLKRRMRYVYWQLCLTRSVCAVLLASLIWVGISRRFEQRRLIQTQRKLVATEIQRDKAQAEANYDEPLLSLPKGIVLCGTYDHAVKNRKVRRLIRGVVVEGKSLSAQDGRFVFTALRDDKDLLMSTLKSQNIRDYNSEQEIKALKAKQDETFKEYDATVRIYEEAYSKEHGVYARLAGLPEGKHLRIYRYLTEQHASFLRWADEEDKQWAEQKAREAAEQAAKEAGKTNPSTPGIPLSDPQSILRQSAVPEGYGFPAND